MTGIDLIGRTLAGDQLREMQMVPIGTGEMRGGEPVMRLLTYEQVRMMRDLWVAGAVMDGYTETVELAVLILRDDPSSVGELSVRELFLAEPAEAEFGAELNDALINKLEPSEETTRVGKALGAAMIRLADSGYLRITA